MSDGLEIEKLLSVMVEKGASDIYLTVDSPPAFRINGVTKPAGNRCLEPEDMEYLSRSIMTDKQQREFEESGEQNLALYYPNFGRFRVNIFRQRGLVAMVIRQIKAQIPSIEALQLPPILKEIVMTKRGLVIVVGATGSGKSTTLASMIDYRNEKESGHIVTIEDPIEFVHSHKKSVVSQREIGMDTDSYHIALKNVLRQAPDVILIGEIRDRESMEAALHCAETGHLCLATLHSNNANQAIERILHLFPADRHQQIYMDLSLNLRAVISQRLLPAISGGRVPAVEVLLDSARVKDLIRKGEIGELKDAMERGSTVGMQTFDEALYNLYRAKKITLDDALANADSANNLRLRIKLSDEKGAFRKAATADPKPTILAD
jgi:twitching motility protein PilU